MLKTERTDPKGKKTKQVSFKVPEDFYAKLTMWADREEIPVADLARKLLVFAAASYGRAGSLHQLKSARTARQIAQDEMAVSASETASQKKREA